LINPRIIPAILLLLDINKHSIYLNIPVFSCFLCVVTTTSASELLRLCESTISLSRSDLNMFAILATVLGLWPMLRMAGRVRGSFGLSAQIGRYTKLAILTLAAQ
jgi:uncharacterized membrane protein